MTREELHAAIAARFSMEDLDEHIRELKSQEASEINTSSLKGQIDYMIEAGGKEWVAELLGIVSPLRGTMRMSEGRQQLRFDIGLELEADPDMEIEGDDLRAAIQAALAYSTAAEAISDAMFARYGECVTMSGWHLKETTGPWMSASEASAVNIEAVRRFVTAAQSRARVTLRSLNAALRALEAAQGGKKKDG